MTSAGKSALELMCGTGRLALPIISAGARFTGLDYSSKLLEIFRSKLQARQLRARLVWADAREFQLDEAFDCIFIGFGSLSEVLKNSDKLQVFRNVRRHLKPFGRFSFSLANAPVQARDLIGERSPWHAFPYGNSGNMLEFSTQFRLDPISRIASGQQFYRVVSASGAIEQETILDLRFHLIERDDVEQLLQESGPEIVQIWGDYERSSFSPESPQLIYRCVST